MPLLIMPLLMESQTSVALGFKDNMVGVQPVYYFACVKIKKLWHETAVLRKVISISLVFIDQCFRMLLSEMLSFQLGHWHFSSGIIWDNH